MWEEKLLVNLIPGHQNISKEDSANENSPTYVCQGLSEVW